MQKGGRSHAVPPQTAEYLAEMADELAATGALSGLPFLAYLFSMAGVEAHTIAGQQHLKPMYRGQVRAETASAPTT